jgi:hypothetical protein
MSRFCAIWLRRIVFGALATAILPLSYPIGWFMLEGDWREAWRITREIWWGMAVGR